MIHVMTIIAQEQCPKYSPPLSGEKASKSRTTKAAPLASLQIRLALRLRASPKPGAGKGMMPMPLVEYIRLLAMAPQHIEPLPTLPPHRRDPFDRLLAAHGLG